jgi:hypothetical protein
MGDPLARRRVWAARGIAVFADVIQVALAPLFFEGALSLFDAVLDICMAGILTWLVGWHWEFLPAFIVEFTPGLDLVPSWTLAVFVATRHRSMPVATMGQGRVIDVEPVRGESGKKI